MSNMVSRTGKLSIWRARLAWKMIWVLFCSLIFVEFLSLYPLARHYEKKELDILSENSLSTLYTLFSLLPQKPNTTEINEATNRLINKTNLKGLIIAHEDGTPFLRTGEKPGHPMNHLPLFGFLFSELRTEGGARYDVSWDNEVTGLPVDITARLDTSHLSQKINLFTIKTAILMFFMIVLMTLITGLIVKRMVLVPILALRARLFGFHAEPLHPERWLSKTLPNNEIGDISEKCDQLLNRLFDARKNARAQEALLELRVEERTQELAQLVNYDRITELPNRNLLQEHLHQFITHSKQDKKNVALFILILRDFHDVTNAFGHSVSMNFLKEVGRHLTENIPAGTCVAHISTSQFAIARGGMAGTHQIANLAQWIVDLFNKPIQVDGHSIVSTINMGVAIYPIDCGDVETLMTNANLALNRAKTSMPNAYQFYEATMNKITEARRTLLSDLHYALERNELLLNYQPQVDLKTKQIVGVEALLRWKHPEKDIIPPSMFVPLAEESGLILSIGEWVIRTACEQALKWQAEGLPKLFVAINLSAIQFAQRNIVEIVNRALRETGLPCEQLELEITESAIMGNVEEAIGTMKALRGLGVSLSLDDFGTGYASLSYLKQFPLQKLKIDQSFVRDIGKTSEQASPLADIVILLGKNLNFTIIAEGVETEEQAIYLEEKGCNEVQGYLFGRPMLPDHFVEFFKTNSHLKRQ
jgi:diguanylate cyclase (GGDEF)-like protein